MNERKLAQMIRVARFEQNIGAEDLRVHKYYRRDYVAYALIKNFFIVTIGYGLLLGVLLLYRMDFLLDNLGNLNIGPLMIMFLTGYVFVLALYSVLVYTIRSLRYLRSERHVKGYYKELKKLQSLQQEEETLQKSRNRQEVR